MRFRLFLESLGSAAGTVNQRLAAVRRLAYEAADFGLLSPALAAGIRGVKGAKQLGARTGNWLTQDHARLLLEKADGDGLRSVHDLAMISVLAGCGLRWDELSALTVEDLQIRQGHWAIVDLVGKGDHVRTLCASLGQESHRPMERLGESIGRRMFRAVRRLGTAWGKGSPRMPFGTSFEGALSIYANVPGSKRWQDYLTRMDRLRDRYPNDINASLFYGLGLTWTA